MAKHEFEIMKNKPNRKERFDNYQPDKYNCIAIDDDFIEEILIDLENINTYWHTLQIPAKGLAYCGITLIPPESMNILIKILSSQNNLQYKPLITLANKAREENKYIIHLGI